MIRFFLISILLCAALGFSADSTVVDTALPHLAVPDLDRVMDVPDSAPAVRSALAAGTLSLLVPGAGQVYDHRPVKGAVFFASEAIAGIVAGNAVWRRNNISKVQEHNAVRARVSLRDSLALYSRSVDSLLYQSALSAYVKASADADLARFSRLTDDFTANQALAIAGGIHLFNVLDAVESSNRFRDERPRKPAVAAALSAIPFLGLGQTYNGALSRTGLCMFAQGCFAYMAWNNQRLIDEAGEARSRLGVTNARDFAVYADGDDDAAHADSAVVAAARSTALANWKSNGDRATSRRNMYLWYLAIFYFYGIADAAVDAHLHDMPGRMRLRPLLEPAAGGRSRIGAELSGSF